MSWYTNEEDPYDEDSEEEMKLVFLRAIVASVVIFLCLGGLAFFMVGCASYNDNEILRVECNCKDSFFTCTKQANEEKLKLKLNH